MMLKKVDTLGYVGRGVMKEIINKLSESLLKLQTEKGAFEDPIFKFCDPRPTAEIAKSLYYLGKVEEAKKALGWLITVQNENGSWNEVLPDLNEESCVATGVVGRILLILYQETNNKKYLKSALKAGEYVLSKEFTPGYFVKSYYHYGDILNVNATCAAFLYALYKQIEEQKYIDARDRAIFNVIRYQFKDGAYPYGAPIRTFPYEWHLNVRDPHYQGITLYFLLLSDPKLENKYLRISAERAIKWLESCLTKNGFDWSKDKLMFSVGITGSYGYAAYCFHYFKKYDALDKVIARLRYLQVDGAYERYEPPSISQTIKGVFSELFEIQHQSSTDYSLPSRLRRSVRRCKRDLIERRNRQFSLYYSAQILDCLTEIDYEGRLD